VGLVVPDKAVDQHGIAPFVVRLKGGKVGKVEVQIGLHDATSETTEITKGLSVGDTLLLAFGGVAAAWLARVSERLKAEGDE